MRFAFFQPRYPHGGRRVYLPGGLLNLGSRLVEAGARARVFDLNMIDLEHTDVQAYLRESDIIGITVLGTPYIPTARNLVERLRAQGYAQRVLVGGEGIIRLTPMQFKRIFRGLDSVQQIMEDHQLAPFIDDARLGSMYEASMVPMMKEMSERELTTYLTREFCLFLSNGCAFNCHFCAAAKNQRERYRSMSALREEIKFISGFLMDIGHHELTVYLSNLDILQTPKALEACLSTAHDIASRHRLNFRARGLSTTKCFINAVKKDPDLPRRLRSYGLDCIGFGADGADIRVWARQNKRHNTLADLEEALALCQSHNIVPEMLMVTGFPTDDTEAMLAAMRYSILHARKGVRIRPYLGKDGAPGSNEWTKGTIPIDAYLDQPEFFTALDYTMVGSEVTHPDRRQRWMANASYLGLLALLALMRKTSTTFPLFPSTARPPLRWIHRLVNRLMPLDR